MFLVSSFSFVLSRLSDAPPLFGPSNFCTTYLPPRHSNAPVLFVLTILFSLWNLWLSFSRKNQLLRWGDIFCQLKTKNTIRFQLHPVSMRPLITFDLFKIFLSLKLVEKSGSCSTGQALAICLQFSRFKRCGKRLKITDLLKKSRFNELTN